MTRLRAWVPALLYAAVIFAFSHQPSVLLPRVSHADKVAHLAAYAVLGVLLAYAARRSGVGPWAALAMALGSLYGASDEFHQSFVPGRSPDAADWVADTLGVVLGTLAYRHWLTRRGGHSARPPRRAHPLAP